MLSALKNMLAGKKTLMGIAAAVVAIISNLLMDKFGIELSEEVKQSTALAIMSWLAFAVADRSERKAQEVKETVVEAVNKVSAVPAKDATAVKNTLSGLINSRNQRGATLRGNLLVLGVMSGAVLFFCGCGLMRPRQGVPVSAAKRYADSIETITAFNTECAIQGKIIAESLRGRTCPDGHPYLTPEEEAIIAQFLDRFSEVDDDDLNQIREAVADLRLAIETAEKAQ